MKKSVLSLLMLFCCVILNAQEYQILHIKGEIKVDGKAIVPGDKINSDQKIQFSSPDAVAAALSPDKGRYIIRVDKSKEIHSDLVYILSATVSPVRGGMSTRAGGITNSSNLKSYFGSKPYVWVGDKIVLKVSPDAYLMDNDHFFFLRYSYEGETINKKLDFEGNNLIFIKTEIFQVDDQPIDKSKVMNYELFHYDQAEEESTIVTPLFFIFLTVEEVEVLSSSLEGVEDKYKEMARILSEFYGNCDEDQLKINLEN